MKVINVNESDYGCGHDHDHGYDYENGHANNYFLDPFPTLSFFAALPNRSRLNFRQIPAFF